MMMYLISIILASILMIPLVLKTVSPYVWKDILYFRDLLWILVRFVSRRRRRPLFLVLDRFLEQTAAHPDKPFIVFGDESFTYAFTDKRSNKIAHALQCQPGYKAGDTVALFMGNEPAFIFTWLALAKLGSPVALLNHNIRTKSLLHCFNCCKAKVMIAAAELKDAVKDVLPLLMEQDVTVLLMTEHCDTPGIESFSDKVDKASDGLLPHSLRSHLTFKSPAVYIYTSGTTGLPKAAVVNQNRLLTALAVLSSNGVSASDVIYVNLPLYHTAGFIIGFIGAIETGSTIILKRKFSASQFWDDCRKHNVTVVQYIGEVMRYLCNTPKVKLDHKVRLAIGNGVRAEIWRDFLNRFGNIEVREFYASTEGNVGFVNYAGKIGAIGRVNFFHKKMFPYTLIKYDTELDEPMRDANGLCVEAPKGETGLLVSKITDIAPFVGYAQNEEQTERKRLRNVLKKGDLYFNSGDLMRIDHDNFIYFQDRVGDTFRDHKVRLAIGNGVRAEIWRDFLNRFGNIEVREFYASTEGNVGFVNYAGKIGAIGRVNFFHKKMFPYTLIKYDTELDEPMRDANGLCVEAPKGETGLLVSKITDIAPFVGYAQNEEQTERKRLRNVLKKGDLYFNSGDLMRIDHDNFIYFQDRVGDTFRWKGENVATTEVSDILTISDNLKEANVYGVQVHGHEGRIGMAAVTVKEGVQFDGSTIYNHVISYLPSYARPRFIRIQNSVELTGTFKQMKVKLVDEGFDPGRIQDPLYILNDSEKSYVPLTAQVYSSITSGNLKL